MRADRENNSVRYMHLKGVAHVLQVPMSGVDRALNHSGEIMGLLDRVGDNLWVPLHRKDLKLRAVEIRGTVAWRPDYWTRDILYGHTWFNPKDGHDDRSERFSKDRGRRNARQRLEDRRHRDRIPMPDSGRPSDCMGRILDSLEAYGSPVRHWMTPGDVAAMFLEARKKYQLPGRVGAGADVVLASVWYAV